MQGPEQEQFPHFFGWLQRQQKSARHPLSAAPRPPSGSGSVDGHGNSNISASISIRRSSSSLRPWSPAADVQDMHGKQQQQLQRPQSPVPDSHRRINSSSTRPSRPSSPQQAARQKRPASAAPNLLVAAQRLQASNATPLNGPSGRPARPFSAAPSRGSANQQLSSQLQRQQQQQQAQPPRWQQQQHLVQMQQGLTPQCSPAGGLDSGAASTTATLARAVDPLTLPVRANSANPRLTQQQQQQTQSQQQQHQQHGGASQHTASPQQTAYCPGSSRPSAQLCCAGSALLTPAWLRPGTATAEPNLRATANSPTGSCCSSPATAAGRASTCHTSRPSSPLGHTGSSYRVSRPTSPACCRPGSTARTATAAGGCAGAGGVSTAAVVSSSPWLCFGSVAPLVWQRVSTPDTLRRLQQQQQQQQGVAAAGEQQQQEYDACQQQQQDELLPVQQQQQQQQCCHQSALQLFRQLPLSGAAAHSSVTREALQQMALGLQLELQRVGAPLDLLAPPLVAHYSSHDSSGVTEGAQAAMAAHTAAAVSAGLGSGVLVGWSALEQVSCL